jgi:hypothetical protein
MDPVDTNDREVVKELKIEGLENTYWLLAADY